MPLPRIALDVVSAQAVASVVKARYSTVSDDHSFVPNYSPDRAR